MLASSTHDTKRSEDVRARLYLLSEIPQRWAETVRRWSSMTKRCRNKDLPDRNTEYFIYQNLVGAWPIDESRFLRFMEKAVREAKAHTSWSRPNEEYEGSVREFISAILSDKVFLDSLRSFVAELEYPGRINSLAQTLLKLTAPGVPDIYQGTELWDLSLVDPDNRRPVDYSQRRATLSTLAEADPDAIMTRMDEGIPKLWLIRQALHLRRERPEVFAGGDYTPLTPRGDKAQHVVAFARDGKVVSVVPRLIIALNGEWGDTTVQLPRVRWQNVLTGESYPGGRIRLARLLARFPVALLSTWGGR
jgi:(1->4)-alpha-D-glucan 1-alpha-D-glucosylmutase